MRPGCPAQFTAPCLGANCFQSCRPHLLVGAGVCDTAARSSVISWCLAADAGACRLGLFWISSHEIATLLASGRCCFCAVTQVPVAGELNVCCGHASPLLHGAVSVGSSVHAHAGHVSSTMTQPMRHYDAFFWRSSRCTTC